MTKKKTPATRQATATKGGKLGGKQVVYRVRDLADVLDEFDLESVHVIVPDDRDALDPSDFALVPLQLINRDIVDFCSVCGMWYANDPGSHRCDGPGKLRRR